MIEVFPVLTAIFALTAVVLLVVILSRTGARGDSAVLQTHLATLREGLDRLERTLREELSRNREEAALSAKQTRDDLSAGLRSFNEGLSARLSEISQLQGNQLEGFSQQIAALTQSTEQRLERMRDTVENRLRMLQEDNSQKLEQMRATVDEKLHQTLERRLGESFKLVSERLERVSQGLGEMQSLASGVGDLKKVLTNVKTRGTWGEIQLGNLLEAILTPEQYSKNVATKDGSSERVDFAIRLPGQSTGDGPPVWLPIDAKFPQEDYQRLVDAAEQANVAMVEEAGKLLEQRIRSEARSIREKYLEPPRTTDFAIMFLPTEGLYAEVTRRPGLCELLQREYRITVAGPNTLVAFLNSLQMGFRTLVIEKRSSEVWSLLGAVKTEFGRFGDILDKTRKKLEEASSTIDNAATRSRQIEKRLKDVQQLPADASTRMLSESTD